MPRSRTAGVRFNHGKRYRGWLLCQIPTAFLRHAQGENLPPDLLAAVDSEVRFRDGRPDPEPEPKAQRPRRRRERRIGWSRL